MAYAEKIYSAIGRCYYFLIDVSLRSVILWVVQIESALAVEQICKGLNEQVAVIFRGLRDGIPLDLF